MKKVLLGMVVASSLLYCCKKVSEGGNHGVLKVDANGARYDSTESRGDSLHAAGTGETATKEVVEVEVKGSKIKAFKGGLEDQMIQFITSDQFTKAASDEDLKDKWFDFDNVTFKSGSSNQLEGTSNEQLKNLAEILKAYPEAKIKVGGNTDKTGKEETNKKISQARAEFIKAELVKLGVGAQVASAEGYGSQFAKAAVDASAEEKAKDRKMSVRFTK